MRNTRLSTSVSTTLSVCCVSDTVEKSIRAFDIAHLTISALSMKNRLVPVFCDLETMIGLFSDKLREL